MEERRLRIRGLHHVTVICRDVERSVDFYRNLLGMRLVEQTVNSDDPSARHLFFGDEEGRPGTMVTCLEYPELEEGWSGPARRTTSRSASETDEELAAWRDYLTGRGVPCTEVMDRTYFKSLYLRDPDGHIVELATEGPGLRLRRERRPGEPGRRAPTPVRLPSAPLASMLVAEASSSPAGAFFCVSTAASAMRWRSVSVPTCLFSGTPSDINNRRQRVRPQRFWLMSRSLIDML